MTPLSRNIIALGVLGCTLLPSSTFAKIGLQEPSSASVSSVSSASSESSESSIDTEQQRWAERASRFPSFWPDMMNARSETTTFRKEHAERRAKRTAKRIACHTDLREANRDAINPVAERCYRELLMLDLEILRKQKMHIEALPNISSSTRGSAVFAIDQLSEALTRIVQGIVAGTYEDRESLQTAKKNIDTSYRTLQRLSLVHLQIERTANWLNHLLLRLHTIAADERTPSQVLTKIDIATSCLELREEGLRSLLQVEDYKALIDEFRQAQSDIKFCLDLAREARLLNTELEQAQGSS